MRKTVCLICSLLLFGFFTNAQETQRLDYDLVSFELPSTWEAYRDNKDLHKRNVRSYNEQSVFWNSSIKSIADIPPIMIKLRIYARLDKAELNIDEIQSFTSMFVTGKKTIIEETYSSERKDLICKIANTDMSGSPVTYIDLCTFYKIGAQIVCLTLSLREDQYKTKEIKELVHKIHASYVFKK